MKRRFLLFLIFIMFVISLTTMVLILNYLDPYEYTILGIVSLLFTYILTCSSIFTFILYLFKKVYFRWNTHIYHILSSFRQAFFISLFFLSLIFFNYIWVSLLLTGTLFFVILFSLELFIKNQED